MQRSGQRYLAMFELLDVLLTDGRRVNVTELDPRVVKKRKEIEKSLQRKDRVEWALRFYEKALIEQLLRMARILSSAGPKPRSFERKFGLLPAANQPVLQQGLEKLAAVDISLFEYETGPDTAHRLGSQVIYEINTVIGRFLQVADTYGKNDPDNLISNLEFKDQSFGEIVLCFRRCEFDLKQDVFNDEPDFEEGDLSCTIKVENELQTGWGWTGALIEAFYDNAFSAYSTEKEFIAALKSGELKRKSTLEIKPMFPLGGDSIDDYTQKRLGDD